MSINDQENEIQVSLQSEFNKLNISDDDSHPIITNHRNCSYCNKPFSEDLWCKECDPFRMIEGWTSGNPDIDKFIKDTIYNAKQYYSGFLEWPCKIHFGKSSFTNLFYIFKSIKWYPFKKYIPISSFIILFIINCILYKLINIWISTGPSFNHSKWVTFLTP